MNEPGRGIRARLGALKERLFYPYAARAATERVLARLEWLERRLLRLQEAVGRIEARQTADLPPEALHDAEFRVFSQWGEDGIIRHLLRHVPVERNYFVEFGVEAYHEANTRFLLIDGNWAGLVLDGDAHAIDRIRGSRLYWLHDLTAVQAWIDRENIDGLIAEHGTTGPIGLLSIDIDGMDWWVWEAVTCVEPAIVVIEYNFRFGPEASVTVPYDAGFDRRTADPSLLYYGASLEALTRLGRRKGYDLVGCGRAGLNAFFVRSALRPDGLPARTSREAFVQGRFHETHMADGRRVKRSVEAQRDHVLGRPLRTIGADGRPEATNGNAEG